jgi:signal transduction histidine kinase
MEDEIRNLEEEIREILVVVVSILILVTLALIALMRVIAGKILRPVELIREMAQNISDKNLAMRIPVSKERDELADLSDTLNLMLDRLQLSFTKQKDFLFDTSHELKTPLTTMRLAIEDLCASEEIAGLPENKRENLFRLESQVLRMERLVKNLLSLSSLEALRGVKMNTVPLSDVLPPLIDEYRFLAECRNIKIETDLPEGLTIRGDGEKLRRAFSNVLDNAIKYNTDSGSGAISIAASRSQDSLTVVISSTGEPVPPDEFQKIFEQFYRVDKSRSLLKGGSGLGLAIVKKTIELHGGEVRFESVDCESRNLNRLIMSFPVRD